MIDLNPTYLKEIFELSVSNKRPVRQTYKMNLVTPKTNQVRYGTKSLRRLAPKIWNSLPVSIKSSESLESLKKLIQVCDGTSCNCYICSKWLPVLFGCVCLFLFYSCGESNWKLLISGSCLVWRGGGGWVILII